MKTDVAIFIGVFVGVLSAWWLWMYEDSNRDWPNSDDVRSGQDRHQDR